MSDWRFDPKEKESKRLTMHYRETMHHLCIYCILSYPIIISTSILLHFQLYNSILRQNIKRRAFQVPSIKRKEYRTTEVVIISVPNFTCQEVKGPTGLSMKKIVWR